MNTIELLNICEEVYVCKTFTTPVVAFALLILKKIALAIFCLTFFLKLFLERFQKYLYNSLKI